MAFQPNHCPVWCRMWVYLDKYRGLFLTYLSRCFYWSPKLLRYRGYHCHWSPSQQLGVWCRARTPYIDTQAKKLLWGNRHSSNGNVVTLVLSGLTWWFCCCHTQDRLFLDNTPFANNTKTTALPHYPKLLQTLSARWYAKTWTTTNQEQPSVMLGKEIIQPLHCKTIWVI